MYSIYLHITRVFSLMCLLSWWECVFLRVVSPHVWEPTQPVSLPFLPLKPMFATFRKEPSRLSCPGHFATFWKWHVVQGHFTSRTTEKYVHVGLMRQGHKFWHLGRCRMVQDVAGINIYMYIYIYTYEYVNELVKGKWKQLFFPPFSLGYVHLPSVSFISWSTNI